MVKTCLPMQGVPVRSLVWELRFHVPRGQKVKHKNRSNIVTKSIKILKMVHIKKKELKKNSKWTGVSADYFFLEKNLFSFVKETILNSKNHV